jgi:hypothetical protein
MNTDILTEISTAVLIENECSRKIANWDLLDLDVEITLPEIVEYYLNDSCWYLAGGAVCDLYRDRRPNDYDLFYVNDAPDAAVCLQEFLQTLRKNKHYETKNCITVVLDDIIIQFIKRVYRAPDQVVGGFDLEPCKFIYKTKVQCTRGALLSCEYRFNPLNLYAQSQNFTTRIIKYSRKSFPQYNMWDVKKYYKMTNNTCDLFDYTYSFNDEEDTYILRNILFMLRKKYDRLYSAGEIITEEKFNSIRVYFDENFDDIELQGNLGFYVYNIRRVNKLDFEQLRTEFLKVYNTLFIVNISNIHTQYTNSFNPTSYPISDFCYEYVPLKLYQKLEIMCILRCTLPKPLRYMILKYWAQTLLN